MAQDATGTPTAKGIPKYNTAVDAPSGKGFNAAMGIIDGLLSDRVTSAGGTLLANKLLAGDANPAFKATGDGALSWGAGGASALDTTLYRSGANTLRTDDFLIVNHGSGILQAGATSAAFRTFANVTDTQPLFMVGTTGQLFFGVGGSTAVDTNLYRTQANILRTDDSLSVGLSLYLDSDDSGQKVYWGSATDTNLYREAANILRTDDDLTVTGRVYMADLWHGSITAANTNGVQAGKKMRIYNGSGVLQGYIQIYTG